MRIDVRYRGVERSAALQEHVERRCHFALSRLAAEVRTVVVRFEDVNGPRGGIDKRCSIVITGPRLRPLTLETMNADVYAAIDQLVDRAARAAIRSLARARSFTRPDGHPPHARRLRRFDNAS